MKEAMLYRKLDHSVVLCDLCGHRCRIKPGKRGICAVRENRDGMLTSMVYRKLIARSVDPIEKKPLFHFLPGSLSYSIATVGCNFHCRHCQNAEIAQMPHDRNRIFGEEIPPQEIVRQAGEMGCATIAYTYTEPTIFFETAYETARMARRQGIRNVFVSNGYMTEEAIDLIAPYLDAVNIDLKGRESFYRKICGAHFQPVVDSIRRMYERGIWVEVTTLVIPGLNDGEDELRYIADVIAAIDPSIPWHLSAFHPAYRLMDRPPTSAEIIRKARSIGRNRGLQYIFVGNLPGEDGEETLCPGCRKQVIRRSGYRILQNSIKNGLCPACGTGIAGVWK
ncbi:MAG: AmmeMemoRadiSam system radical SAM enzyme [Deltaproteobacteria bacterium]|nr:AmmeMemoRadiSam system radical SAM enzyme [Deltaproteobacteria bacterium]